MKSQLRRECYNIPVFMEKCCIIQIDIHGQEEVNDLM